MGSGIHRITQIFTSTCFAGCGPTTPERRDAMAHAMGLYGNTRAYVARTVEELFPGQPLPWAQRYSRHLVEGWYVDTNLNRERMRRSRLPYVLLD